MPSPKPKANWFPRFAQHLKDNLAPYGAGGTLAATGAISILGGDDVDMGGDGVRLPNQDFGPENIDALMAEYGFGWNKQQSAYRPTPANPVVAVKNPKTAANPPPAASRQQRLTTEKDRIEGNVPWGVMNEGSYITPNFKADTAHVIGLDDQPNQRAINDILAMNARGRMTAVQQTRDINSQALDPNSPMSMALARMAEQKRRQEELNILRREYGHRIDTDPSLGELRRDLPQGYAEGGYISKRDGVPVNAGRDNRMIAAQDGEFVLSRRAVQMLGLKNLEQLNRMAAGPDANEPTNNRGLMGYADGGMVKSPTFRGAWRGEEISQKPSEALLQLGGGEGYREFNNKMKRDWAEINPYVNYTEIAETAGESADDFARIGRSIREHGLGKTLTGRGNTSGTNPKMWESKAAYDKAAKAAKRAGTKPPLTNKELAKAGKAARAGAYLSLYDMGASALSELSGTDVSVGAVLGRASTGQLLPWQTPMTDEEGNPVEYDWNLNQFNQSKKGRRAMANAGVDTLDEVGVGHRTLGVLEAVANSAAAGGYDAVRGTFDPEWAARAGVDVDPYGAGRRMSEFVDDMNISYSNGKWSFGDENLAENKRQQLRLLQKRAEAGDERAKYDMLVRQLKKEAPMFGYDNRRTIRTAEGEIENPLYTPEENRPFLGKFLHHTLGKIGKTSKAVGETLTDYILSGGAHSKKNSLPQNTQKANRETIAHAGVTAADSRNVNDKYFARRKGKKG